MKLLARFSNMRDEIEARLYAAEDGHLHVTLFDLASFDVIAQRIYPAGHDNAAFNYARLMAAY